MQNAERILNRIAYWAIMATALTPLVIDSRIFFPYAFAKALWFRGCVTLALIAACAGYLLQVFGNNPRRPRLAGVKASLAGHPIVITLLLFLVSFSVSAALAPNGYRAFWGEMERTEGVFGMLYYYAFFFLLLHTFKKDSVQEIKSLPRSRPTGRGWLQYFQFSLIVGAILIIYAVFEYFGWTWIPFGRDPAPRPGSLIGNSAFLAVHLLFSIILGGIVYALSDSRKWRSAALTFGALAAATIFLTGTRGVILGLGAGIIVWLITVAIRPFASSVIPAPRPSEAFSEGGKAGIQRRFAITALVLIALFGGTFFATRTASFWQHIPGLDRLASTAALDPNDPSTQTRLLTWKVSWEAFQEKPFFGWGPENYLYAWERHYEPSYALYGETWLDRAHNKAFDLLVMQGVFGLLAYLALLAALAWVLARKGIPGSRIIAAGVVAYVLQNLLLLDQVLSYLMFFALLAYVVANSKEPVSAPATAGKQLANGYVLRTTYYVLAAALALAAAYAAYAYALVPYRQSRAMFHSANAGDIRQVISSIKRGMYPYNYAQYTIRSQAIDSMYLEGYFYRDEYRKNPSFKEPGDLFLSGTRELREREPYDVRVFIREAQMLATYGPEDSSFYERAVEVLKHATEIAPARQEVYYHLAVDLARLGRADEAIAAAKQAIELEPGVARAHLHYALVLAILGQGPAAETELDRALTLDPDMSLFLGGDPDTMVSIYEAAGVPEKAVALVMKSVRGETSQRFSSDRYQATLAWYIERKDEGAVTEIAQFMLSTVELRDDAEVILDLAGKGQWEIIWRL